MDGHPRQNPAYRPATEKASETGLFLLWRVARNSSRFRSGSPSAVSLEPLSAGARRSPCGCVGVAPPPRVEASSTVDRAQGAAGGEHGGGFVQLVVGDVRVAADSREIGVAEVGGDEAGIARLLAQTNSGGVGGGGRGGT